MATNEEKDYTVPALARGLSILEFFNQERRVLSTQELADQLGLSKAAIYRIVQTLTEMQYLNKLARNTYELGPAVVSLGYSFLASRDLSDVAAPHLNRLRDATSVSCHLAIRDGREALYIYRALASQRLSVNVPVGTRLPCHTCAVGRVLLSGLSPDALSQLYLGAQLDGVPKPNPQSLPELRQRIDKELVQGYATSQSDFATAIAAPVRNYANEIVGAINISGPDAFMQGAGGRGEILGEILGELLGAAVGVSRGLGCRR